MLLKFLILSIVVIVSSEKVRYDNYALYKVEPKNEDQVKFLKELEKNEDLDFWKSVNQAGDYASIAAPPEMRKKFEHSLKKRSIYSEMVLDNIQEAFDAQLYSRKRRSAEPELFWTNYQTIDDIYEWFEHLAQTQSNIVSLITVGRSFEGRNITGIKISRGNSDRNFVIEGGQIGADWLSPTVITYIVDQLVRGEDPEALQASQDFTWHIFPIVNPDGHQFSQDSVRLWTKNRTPTLLSNAAIGVDLSRNWNSHWGVQGGSFTPSANNYVGLGPFSEVETRQMARYLDSIGGSTTGFLSLRSFGQRLLIPFAHSATPLYNFNEMVTIGRRAMGSLAVKYGTQYLVGTSLQFSDGSTGTSADWIKFRFNPPIVATYLLRDQGGWGYTLPVAQVLPSCEETYDSVMAILREARFINVI
ncbi:zinc carboxypeptidase-like [Ostrinia nubilalis]|uniref:zinc carboxypeptidase-like n=1 Tax=Ostrinia nubilalis TaxID=29057 RepID=UPI0030824144